jgi:NTE family protein
MFCSEYTNKNSFLLFSTDEKYIFVLEPVLFMTVRQLYITMFLLIALWGLLQRNAWNQPADLVIPPQTNNAFTYEVPSVRQMLHRKSSEKYELGLALGGGGMKGFCHLGVLKAMEQEGFRPDVLSGVSAGAIIAALYADGYSPDSIFSMFENVDFIDYMSLKMPDGGLFALDGLRNFLDTVLRAKTFEELKIPLRVVVTDLDQGQSVVFDKGPLVDVLVASCSVPILFSPKMINGVNYVDGGLLHNLPAFALRPDCKVLVGVSLGPLNADAYEKTITAVAMRSYRFIFRSNANYDRALCDLLVEPKSLSKYSGGDVECGKEIFDLGYRTMMQMLKEKKVKPVE